MYPHPKCTELFHLSGSAFDLPRQRSRSIFHHDNTANSRQREILKLPSNFKLPGRKFLKKQSDIQKSLASVSFGVIQACYIKVIFVIMAAGVLFPQKHRSTSPLFSSMMSNSSDVQPVALMPPFALCKSSPLLIVFFDQERRFQPSSQEAIAALINESRFYLEVLNL